MIHFGQVMLWLALAGGVVAFVAKWTFLRTEDARADVVFRRSILASTLLLGATFLLLCFMFLSLDLSVLYVWTYTGTWVPWQYRLSGAWTGREGSLLLWTAFSAAVIAVMAHRVRKEDGDGAETTARDWTDLIMAAILVAFLVAVVRQGTFVPTDSFLLTGRPQGNGLNPLLISPYILIHPPLMFLAYAMTIVPAASGIAHMVTGTDRWSNVASKTSRVDWVLYTFAMGLGGLWAYYTLGFGGYWAWDPVEVANLLPWLALTVYLHAQMMHGRRGWFGGVGPLLAVLPFVLTVFSTVSTRSGLWVSVHAFTDPSNTFDPDAAARLLGILEVDPSLLPYFGILLGVLLISLALWCRRLAMDHRTMRRSSRVIAAVLAVAGGVAWVTPALFLSLVFEAGALVGSPGLGALGLFALAVLAAASPSLMGHDEPDEKEAKKGWKRFIDVAPLAALSVLLLSLLLVVSLMWHFAAVNGWSEAFWDARIPWLLTPVVLALTVLMLRGRGRRTALTAAGVLLVAGLVVHSIGGLGHYAVFMASGFLLAALDKMKTIGFSGERPLRWRGFLLWVAAILDLLFWVDPPSSLLGGALSGGWPQHVVMIPLSVLAVIGAHLVGIGRRLRWPFWLAAALGGYYIAPIIVLVAATLRRRGPLPNKPLVFKRARPVGVYGVHLAVAVLMVGYATSTYFEVQDTFELTTEGDGDGGNFTLGGKPYNAGFAQATLGDEPVRGAVQEFTVVLRDDDRDPERGAVARLAWQPQTGTYQPAPSVLRLWDRDLYVTLDAVCVSPLDVNGDCPPDGWVEAHQQGNLVVNADAPTAFRITAWSLPGVNLVWGALALFVVYGFPMAAFNDPGAVHRPQPSKPSKPET